MRELGVDAALQEEAAVLASKLGGDGELDEYFDVDDYLESLPEPEEEEAVDEEAEDCDVGAGQNACDSYLEGLTNWAYTGRSLSKPQGYEPETWFQNLLLSFGSRTFAAMRGRLVATALFAWVVAWAHSPHAALGPRAWPRGTYRWQPVLPAVDGGAAVNFLPVRKREGAIYAWYAYYCARAATWLVTTLEGLDAAEIRLAASRASRPLWLDVQPGGQAPTGDALAGAHLLL
mgnify:CR=1 FL=1